MVRVPRRCMAFQSIMLAACGLALGLSCANVSSASEDEVSEARLPACQIAPTRADFYPDAARARGIEGRVLVEFGLKADGTPSDVRILAEEPTGGPFGMSAVARTKLLRCAIPEEWRTRDLNALRFQSSFLYRLIPCPNPDDCSNPTAYPTSTGLSQVVVAEARAALRTQCAANQCLLRVRVPIFIGHGQQIGGVQLKVDPGSRMPAAISIELPPDASIDAGVAIQFVAAGKADPRLAPVGDPLSLPILKCNEEICTAEVPDSQENGAGTLPDVYQGLQHSEFLSITYQHGGKNVQFEVPTWGFSAALKALPRAVPIAPVPPAPPSP